RVSGDRDFAGGSRLQGARAGDFRRGQGAGAGRRRCARLGIAGRARFGAGGPFLYGAFGAADAMYAPMGSRFPTYGVEVGAVARDYMRAVMALPAWKEWRDAALRETWVLPHDEVDWPEVKRE